MAASRPRAWASSLAPALEALAAISSGVAVGRIWTVTASLPSDVRSNEPVTCQRALGTGARANSSGGPSNRKGGTVASRSASKAGSPWRR